MMKLFAALLFLLISTAHASLPPTTTQGANDVGKVTTFNFGYPFFNLTHTGTNASVSSFEDPIYAQIATPANPSAGFDKCYVKADDKFYCLSSAGVESLIGPAVIPPAWLLAGNAGTTAGTDFVGTTDAQDVVFKRNSVEEMRLSATLALWSEVLQVPAGSAATPGVNFTTATTSGIYAPAANSFGISANGTQWLNVDSSGNGSINTASSAGSLRIKSRADGLAEGLQLEGPSVSGNRFWDFYINASNDLFIYNPGANIVAFEAIVATGFVGVGPQSATSPFFLSSASASTNPGALDAGVGGAIINAKNFDATAGNFSAFTTQLNSATNAIDNAFVGIHDDHVVKTGHIELWTELAGVLSKRFSLDATGGIFTGTVSATNLSGTNTGDVTLTAVGAVPNANGASLSGQALTLQPANTTFPGVLTAADWNTFNGKQAAISTSAAVANQFLTGFTAPNTFTRAQPAFTDISGSVTAAQMLALPNTQIYIGNGSNQPAAVAMSGGATISNTGVVTLVGQGLVEVFTGHILSPGNYTFVIDQSAAYAYTINSIIVQTSSGTDTLALKINGTNVTGCSAVSVSSTPATGTCTAANSVAIADRFTLVTSSDSSAVDLTFTVKVTRQ